MYHNKDTYFVYECGIYVKQSFEIIRTEYSKKSKCFN